MNFAKNALILAGLVSLISACGDMKQDATSKYKDLEREAGPEHNQVYQRQTGFGSAPYSLDLKPAEFTVGKAGQHKLSVQAKNGLNVVLSLANQPQGMNLTQQSETQYVVTWTPTEKEVPLYKSQGRRTVKIVARVDEASSRAEALRAVSEDSLTTEHPLEVVVNRPEGSASIKFNGQDLPATLEEGQSATFSIEVKDPTTSAEPKVTFVEVDSKSLNGAQFIAIDLNNGMKRTASGSYTTMGVFNADLSKISSEARKTLAASNGKVQVSFGFAVTSANSGEMIETQLKTVSIALDKSDSTPVIQIRTSSATAARNKTNKITITAGAKNVNAKTSIDVAALKSSLDLPGKVEVTGCDAAKEQNNKCVINWTVACDAADLKPEYTVNVTANTVIYGETKSATESKTLKLAPACPVKKKPTVKKPTTTSNSPAAGGNK